MAYKVHYDSKEDIPEALREFFVENGEGYKFDADDYETDAEVVNLKKTLNKERDNAKEFKNTLNNYPDDFNADKWDSVKHIDPENINNEGDEALKSQISSLQDTNTNLKDKVGSLETSLTEQKDFNKNNYQKAAIKDALVGAGVTNEVLLDSALNWIQGNERVNTTEADNGYKTTLGDMDKAPKEFAQKFVTTDVGKNFATAANNHGGGSRNNGNMTSTGVKSKKDFKGVKDKTDWISEHGRDAFKELPNS